MKVLSPLGRSACTPRGMRALACACVLASGAAHAVDASAPAVRDTIIARANEAWQDEDGRVMHFNGDLRLRGSQWHITADRARVEGRLEDPDLITVDGDPARIVVDAANSTEPVEGHCQHLEFEPRDQKLHLQGEAMVVKGEQSISSETIQYLLQRNNFTAGSVGRVKVVTKPRFK